MSQLSKQPDASSPFTAYGVAIPSLEDALILMLHGPGRMQPEMRRETPLPCQGHCDKNEIGQHQNTVTHLPC